MYTPDITLTDGSTPLTFSLVSTKGTSTLRAVASQPLAEPITLSIAHQEQKNGVVSSVAYIDSSIIIEDSNGNPVDNTARVQIKMTYDPSTGRANLKDELKAQLARLTAFLADSANADKFLNKES